jgi:hypothetical protein
MAQQVWSIQRARQSTLRPRVAATTKSDGMWEEAILDRRAGRRDARLDHREFMRDGVLAFVLHGAGDHRLVRWRRVDNTGPGDVPSWS